MLMGFVLGLEVFVLLTLSWLRITLILVDLLQGFYYMFFLDLCGIYRLNFLLDLVHVQPIFEVPHLSKMVVLSRERAPLQTNSGFAFVFLFRRSLWAHWCSRRIWIFFQKILQALLKAIHVLLMEKVFLLLKFWSFDLFPLIRDRSKWTTEVLLFNHVLHWELFGEELRTNAVRLVVLVPCLLVVIDDRRFLIIVVRLFAYPVILVESATCQLIELGLLSWNQLLRKFLWSNPPITLLVMQVAASII